MAERKSGPVKPPVIDLKARAAPKPEAEQKAAAPDAAAEPAAAAAEPAAAAAAKSGSKARTATPERPSADAPERGPESPESPKSAAAPPPPPRPQARLAMPWSAISIAAAGGALLGAGLVYLLASWIALPSSTPPIEDPAPALAAQAERLSALEERYAALEESTTDTRIGLDATIQQLDSGFADIRRSVEALREAMPEPVTVELSGIEAQLQTLESRLDATAAGASSGDAAALAESLGGIERSVAALTSRLGQLDQKLVATDTAVAGLGERLTGVSAAVTAQNATLGGSDIGPTVRLPLVVAGLETAFATGRPYATELQSLTTLLPDLTVPASLEAASETGLPRPDVLARRFSDEVPDILAGRTATTTGDWTQDAVEWAKALLAVRPAGEIEGDSPEAVVSRLEAAIERRSFVAAARLVTELPEPMRAAAGELAADILVHAEAETFISGLRTQALAPAAEATP